MAILAKMGTFMSAIPRYSYLTISGIGFQPKAVLFWWGGVDYDNITASGGPTTYDSYFNFGMGASAAWLADNPGGYNVAVNNYIRDGVTTTNTLYGTSENRCVYPYSRGYLYMNQYQPDGFRFYNADAASSYPMEITYLALGGDDLTDAYAYFYNLITFSGEQSITISGYLRPWFQPDALLCFESYYAGTGIGTHMRGGMGWGTEEEQSSISYYDPSNLATSNNVSSALEGYISSNQNSTHDGYGLLVKLLQFTPSGFIVGSEKATGSTYPHLYLALKGGRYKLGHFTTSTLEEDIDVITGFEPEVILFRSINNPIASGIVDDVSVSFGGVVTGDNDLRKKGYGIRSKDNAPVSEVVSANYDNIIYANVRNDGIVSLMDFKTVIPSGFRVTMLQGDETENYVSYLAIGNNDLRVRSNTSAFMWGQDHPTTSQHAWLYGHDPNGLEVHAHTWGQLENVRTSTPAWMAGGIITSNSAHAYTNITAGSLWSNTNFFDVDITKTEGQTQSITGMEFTPQLLLLWWVGDNFLEAIRDPDSHDSYGDTDLNFGFGAAKDSTHRFCLASFVQDNVSVTNTLRSQNETEIMRSYVPSGSTAVVDGILDLYSMDDGGFTVVFDKQFTRQIKIGYLALGGKGSPQIYLGNGTLPTASGYLDVTDAGFDPDFLIFLTQNQYSIPDETPDAGISVGFADKAGNNVSVAIFDQSIAPTTVAKKIYSNDYLYTPMGTDGYVYYIGKLDSMLPSGFRLNHIEGGVAGIFNYIAVKGWQGYAGGMISDYDYQNYPTGITASGVGFKPNCIIMVSDIDSYGAYNNQVRPDLEHSMGFAVTPGGSQITQISQYMVDYDDYSSTYPWCGDINNAVYMNADYWGIMEVQSFNNDGFTIVMQDTGSYDIGAFLAYLAIGSAIETTDIPCYMYGEAHPTDSIPAFAEGTLTNARQQRASYTRGMSTGTDSTTCYMFGVIAVSDNIPVYLVAEDYDISSTYAFIDGNAFTLSSKSCYIEACTVNSVHCYTNGYSPNISAQFAYIKGIDFGPRIWTT